jgi:hypothetical protein
VESVPRLDKVPSFRPLVSHGILAWGCVMPGYRLYFMNELGHIEQVGEFDADDDDIAIAAVERARGIAPMELWCRTHKVKHWDAIPVSSPTVSA